MKAAFRKLGYELTEAGDITGFYTVADKPFSFSILPYTTKELLQAKHSFEQRWCYLVIS